MAITAPAQEWQVVLRASSSRLVLYHPPSNQLRLSRPRHQLLDDSESDWDTDPYTAEQHDGYLDDDDEVQELERPPSPPININQCPYCMRPMPPPPPVVPAQPHAAHQSYFALLGRTSAPGTPRPRSPVRERERSGGGDSQGGIPRASMAQGYYQSFFQEMDLLGKGGKGSVYLVRHVLNGEMLGLYACKQVPVGQSGKSLLRILKEVHLLERLKHRNVVNYHHAWVEEKAATAFIPSIPTAYILMDWANGGSLASFILSRSGHSPPTTLGSASARKAAFRARRRHPHEGAGPVHLLGLEEITHIFAGVASGLEFLHSKGLLHLDLKADNVLLHFEADEILPTAKLSDFGESADGAAFRMHGGGGTAMEAEEEGGGRGAYTLEWCPPETWSMDPSTGHVRLPDRATDLWALGLVLHLLCFLRLPYSSCSLEEEQTSLQQVKEEIMAYPGYRRDGAGGERRVDLPDNVFDCLERLCDRDPARRLPAREVGRRMRAMKAFAAAGARSSGRAQSFGEREKERRKRRSPSRSPATEVLALLDSSPPARPSLTSSSSKGSLLPSSASAEVALVAEEVESDVEAPARAAAPTMKNGTLLLTPTRTSFLPLPSPPAMVQDPVDNRARPLLAMSKGQTAFLLGLAIKYAVLAFSTRPSQPGIGDLAILMCAVALEMRMAETGYYAREAPWAVTGGVCLLFGMRGIRRIGGLDG